MDVYTSLAKLNVMAGFLTMAVTGRHSAAPFIPAGAVRPNDLTLGCAGSAAKMPRFGRRTAGSLNVSRPARSAIIHLDEWRPSPHFRASSTRIAQHHTTIGSAPIENDTRGS
jgi:hypothetical protein